MRPVLAQLAGYPTLGLLARDEPARARQLSDELIAYWPNERGTLQHFFHAQALSYIDLYEGRGGAVLERLEALVPQGRRALQIAPTRCLLYDLRARAAVMESGHRQGSEVGRLLSSAEADAKRLEREGLKSARVQAALLRAGIAWRRSGREEALEGYGRAVELAEAQRMQLHAEAARWRQAELLGGEGGRTRLKELSLGMRERGLLVPEALGGMVAPAADGV